MRVGAVLRNRWATWGPRHPLPQPCPAPNLCPMLRTFSGHLTELQALVLKGAPGKWLFSQWNLPLEPSVAEWSFCPGGRGGEESGEGEPSGFDLTPALPPTLQSCPGGIPQSTVWEPKPLILHPGKLRHREGKRRAQVLTARDPPQAVPHC